MAILSINIDRLRRDIDNLARFTRGPGPGVTRLTFSEEARAARAYLRDPLEAIGLRDVELPPGIMTAQLESTPASGLDAHRLHRGRAKAFLELHIEQSVVLEEAAVQIGVVTTVTGIRGFDATLVGIANHAGATPMARRRDALAGAAQLMAELER